MATPESLRETYKRNANLLQAERPAEAERVYNEDHERFPNNGWSLFGLAESLRAQGKNAETKKVQQRSEETWQYADGTLASLRM